MRLAQGRREKPDTEDRAHRRHFSDVFRTTRTRFGAFPKASTAVSCLPYAIPPRDSDANRGQLRRCVPSPHPPPPSRETTSTSIEITLIYCGTERLARSIIRLSRVGSSCEAKSLAFSLPSMDRPSLAGPHCHLCVRRPADE